MFQDMYDLMMTLEVILYELIILFYNYFGSKYGTGNEFI